MSPNPSLPQKLRAPSLRHFSGARVGNHDPLLAWEVQ
jgi:hypothetical protein